MILDYRFVVDLITALKPIPTLNRSVLMFTVNIEMIFILLHIVIAATSTITPSDFSIDGFQHVKDRLPHHDPLKYGAKFMLKTREEYRITQTTW